MTRKLAQKILQLTIEREYFDAIVAGTKRTEYRERKPFWKRRLEGRHYDAIRFRNGYTRGVPEAYVEFRGLGKDSKGRYAIRLGRVLRTKTLRRKKSAAKRVAES